MAMNILNRLREFLKWRNLQNDTKLPIVRSLIEEAKSSLPQVEKNLQLYNGFQPVGNVVNTDFNKNIPFPAYQFLSDSAKKIIDSKPHAWEYILFGKVLIDEVNRFDPPSAIELLKRESTASKFEYHINSHMELVKFPSWLIDKSKEYIQICKKVCLLEPDNHDEIFGKQGQSGNSEKIVELCSRMSIAFLAVIQFISSMKHCQVTCAETIRESYGLEIDLFTESVKAYFISEEVTFRKFCDTLGQNILEDIHSGSSSLRMTYVLGTPELNSAPLFEKLTVTSESSKFEQNDAKTSKDLRTKSTYRSNSSIQTEILDNSLERAIQFMSPPVQGTEIAFLDLETTGLNPYSDRIIEIGLVIITVGKSERLSWSDTIKIDFPISDFISEYTGISNAQLESSLPAREVLTKYFERIGNRVVAAYNSQFDIGFLHQEAKRLGIEFTNQSFCVMKQAKTALKFLEGGYKLGNVASSLGLRSEKKLHRALADVELTILVCEAIWSKNKSLSNGLELDIANTLIHPDSGKKISTPKLDFTNEEGVPNFV